MSDNHNQRLTELGQELTAEDFERHDPPADLWESIVEALSDDDADGHADEQSGDQPSETEGARVLVFDRMRRSRVVLPVMAAAAAVVVLVGALAVFSARGDDDTLLTEVAMSDEGLQVAAPGDGTARLIDTDDGLVVDLELPTLPDRDGFYEAWLIDTDVDGMFSLGPVDGDGRVAVPAGVDPADFPIVDISVEALDGDPTHSGTSVLRGVLEV